MRHNKKGRKLGTDYSHTKAMKRSLVSALFLNDRIKTVESRAKEIRPQVDKVITWAKRGDLHSRRLAIAYLNDKELVREIFEKVAQGMFQDRPGGYTRIMKLGPRKGDNAPMVIMELVTEPCVPKAERKAAAEKKAAAKKAAPKKVAKKADKSEELAEDLGFEADGTVEQIEAVDAAEAVAENGAEMTDAEKVEAVEEKKAEEAEAFRETEETAGDPAEAAKEEAEKKRLAEERRKKEQAISNKVAGAFGMGSQEGNSQGDAESGTGNQGSPFGNSDHGANEGVGGYGSFNLNGRSIGRGGLPRPAYTIQEEGRIVINITVDPKGNVIFAEIGKGTNIDNGSMRKSALDAAKRAKFNSISGANNQSGTITYLYKLK